ncbi:hypothetical protein VSR68_11385 [Paraburkholderia phymatum]|uniref:hypothetical protein n=1 Tax=Paraburkholderia phymatum TaxID=148447 RepID=UPI00316ED275
MTAGVQWWLAELDMHGNPTLVDGSHSERAGADKAAYLYQQLGIAKGRRFAVARVELSEPTPSNKGVNQEALAACQGMIAATKSGDKA